MKAVASVSGQELRDMLSTAANWLEKSSTDIDALNVFPVPDGDTGTNMLLTLRSSVEEAYRAPDSSASAVALAAARGALMGARGNSGVILSQICRGLAEGLRNKESFVAVDLAAALTSASVAAYKGISNPVEGTILTVMKDAAAAAENKINDGATTLQAVMEAAVSAAAESVANTPELLPVLRKSGVVDAGGQGLYTILDGMLRHLRGEAEQMQFRKPQLVASNLPAQGRVQPPAHSDETPYGYCTEFMLQGVKLVSDSIKNRLQKKGQSLIVVGDENNVRVHIHTNDPGSVVKYATSLGTMHQVSIRNMDEQYQDFLEMQKDRGVAVETGTVAVVAGDGLADVFTSLGVAAIVPGGQSMNPSTKDILQAVKSVPAEKVFILPNNKNVILTANQVQGLTEKTVEVVPTETIPQGIASLLAFDYEADFETNAKLMKVAKEHVKTVEITRAVRSAQINDLRIKRKQVIGLVDGELKEAGNAPQEVLIKLLSKINLEKAEIVTVYYGADTSADEAERVSTGISDEFPDLQVEVVRGGQPHYNYILSVE